MFMPPLLGSNKTTAAGGAPSFQLPKHLASWEAMAWAFKFPCLGLLAFLFVVSQNRKVNGRPASNCISGH